MNVIQNRYIDFPEISYEEFQEIPYIQDRKEIAKRNKIMRTDAYNRTMDYTKEERWDKNETFFLSLRKSPNDKYNIIYWIKNIVDEICRRPFTQNELDFAIDFYKDQETKGWNSKFNANRWQKIINENNWMLPIKISAVEDGTVLKPGEPAMTVEGEAEFAAIFEPIFLRLFYQSVTATNAQMIEEIIGEWRTVEFWYRASINDEMHMNGMEANYVWAWINKTSADITAAALNMMADWTTAHRYFTAYPTEDEAMVQAIEKNDKIWLLVDSVEAYAGIDKIMNLKKKYQTKGKIIAPRLDSWNIANQAVYAIQKQVEMWMIDSNTNKIVAADISSIEDIIKIETAVTEAGYNPKDYIVYGLWGLLIAREKTRDIVSAWYKLSNTENWATMKFAKWKNSIPGKPNIEIRDWKRYIVQEDEKVNWVRLLTPMYDNWEFFYERMKIEDMDKARNRMKETKKDIEFETIYSEETKSLIEEVKQRVGI